MCGRFALTISPTALAKMFQLADITPLEARYNIAPSQPVASVVQPPESSERTLKTFRWGLIPPWAKDPTIGNRLINARSETVAEKPAFRDAFKTKRCLIPANGFYEWQKQTTRKQPYFIRLHDAEALALAGLYQCWTAPDPPGQTTIESCTILTTAANQLMQPLHHRMPVIINPADYPLWLDTSLHKPKLFQKLFTPFPAQKMTAHPVSPLVNSPRNNTPQCLKPIDEPNLF